jgi:hypothetical protein
MGVREAIQKNWIAGVAAAALLLLIAVIIAAKNSPAPHPTPTATGSFYSDDDGSTYFADNIFHFPPFDHQGKTAYRARVYSASSGAFVGFLERYTPQTRNMLLDNYAQAEAGAKPRSELLDLIGSWDVIKGIEYKLPGPGHEWTHDRPQVKSPDGGDCVLVMP